MIYTYKHNEYNTFFFLFKWPKSYSIFSIVAALANIVLDLILYSPEIEKKLLGMFRISYPLVMYKVVLHTYRFNLKGQ